MLSKCQSIGKVVITVLIYNSWWRINLNTFTFIMCIFLCKITWAQMVHMYPKHGRLFKKKDIHQRNCPFVVSAKPFSKLHHWRRILILMSKAFKLHSSYNNFGIKKQQRTAFGTRRQRIIVLNNQFFCSNNFVRQIQKIKTWNNFLNEILLCSLTAHSFLCYITKIERVGVLLAQINTRRKMAVD